MRAQSTEPVEEPHTRRQALTSARDLRTWWTLPTVPAPPIRPELARHIHRATDRRREQRIRPAARATRRGLPLHVVDRFALRLGRTGRPDGAGLTAPGSPAQGNRITFGRYTSETPVAGELLKDGEANLAKVS